MKNHCIKDLSYPKLSALCIGAVVIFLKKYIVEEKLMNGSVGTVMDSVYDHRRGPNNTGRLPFYVVVDFLDYSLIPSSPSKYIFPFL